MNLSRNCKRVLDELIPVINDWDRPSPLRGIARIKYLRELQALPIDENSFRVALFQKTYEYKYKGKKKPVAKLDVEAIARVLNERLTTAVVTSAVQDNYKLYVTLEVKSNEESSCC